MKIKFRMQTPQGFETLEEEFELNELGISYVAWNNATEQVRTNWIFAALKDWVYENMLSTWCIVLDEKKEN